MGFGIHYHDPVKNEINCLNTDIISDFDGSSAIDLIRAFKFLMSLDSFKSIEKNNIIIWSDSGTQFRCQELIFFFQHHG